MLASSTALPLIFGSQVMSYDFAPVWSYVFSFLSLGTTFKMF